MGMNVLSLKSVDELKDLMAHQQMSLTGKLLRLRKWLRRAVGS